MTSEITDKLTAPARSITEAIKGNPFRDRVEAELSRAYAKHGREPWSRHEFFAILREEVDELWDAIKQDQPIEQVLAEAAQIACVCQRYAETGDRYRGPHTVPPAQPPAVAAGERRSGTTPLHGRPLDENGTIAFIAPPAAKPDAEQLKRLGDAETAAVNAAEDCPAHAVSSIPLGAAAIGAPTP